MSLSRAAVAAITAVEEERLHFRDEHIGFTEEVARLRELRSG